MRRQSQVPIKASRSARTGVFIGASFAIWIMLAGCTPPTPADFANATVSPVPTGAPPQPGSVMVTLEDRVRSWVDGGRVEVPGRVALDQGWLEVAVCRRGSREHESIVVVDVEPSVVHAALLLAGFEPGSPAVWNRRSGWTEATGDPIAILLQVVERGRRRDVPLASAIRDERGDRSPTWVFAGSRFDRSTDGAPADGRYVADVSGTVVGLSTFGDEVVAGREIRSPDSTIDPVIWSIRRGILPPVDSEVTVVFTTPGSEAAATGSYADPSSGS